jgi:hypothetical protein
MSYIKSFEGFAGKPLPTTSVDFLLDYKLCRNCNALYYAYNKKNTNKCKYCESSNIDIISEYEFYKILKSRVSPEEYNEIEQDRRMSKDKLVDLSVNTKDNN